MVVVTSGKKYIDIDAYASCIAYAKLLNLKGIKARAISTAKYIAERNSLKINIDSSLNERRLRKFRRIRGIRRKVKSSLYNRTNA